ncbi:FecR family protein [Thermoflexibacter ruber]|uniref:Ferric-dicitrate binding protein FerR, regulates iron transport through sigma-19 n=1 Tax=Thermoflexibacter ruber TaxID=1003 RepID=A0A1I2H0K7_9BACT|nr:FecR domain-containing protein [Thermoflexibacter ruber]SFF23192.1 ferric-dicitrate binding protein FerR, regulates iron transport through sigma-19 [Thermoflexibacter ruber]
MEKQTPIVNDDLIAKFLAGEADNTESEAVNDWILESEKNENYFFEAQKTWEKASRSRNFRKVNTDAAWQKWQSKEAKVVQLKPKRTAVPFMQIAAAVVLLLGVSTIWYLVTKQNIEQVAFVTKEKVDSLLLADGTQVFVNRESKITYPKEFSGKKRRVKLEGEAFFQVQSDKEKPFVVETQSTEIQVVGTAFNVKSTFALQRTEVVVQEGKVLVRSGKDSLYLNAGEQVTVEKDKIQRKESIQDKNFLAYKTRLLVFEKTSLNEVIAKINALYATEIILKNKALGNCPITVTFDDASIEEIIDIITQTHQGLRVSKEGKRFVFEGERCE